MGKLTIPVQIMTAALAGAYNARHELHHDRATDPKGPPTTSEIDFATVEGAVRAAFLAAAQLFPAPQPAPAGKLSIPLTVIEAARRAGRDAAMNYVERCRFNEGRDFPLDPNGEILARVQAEAMIAAGMRMMAQLSPAPPPAPAEPEPEPPAALFATLLRFRAAVYELAGPRPKIGPFEPDWNVDLFEVERRVAHQEQPDGAEPLVQPAE